MYKRIKEKLDSWDLKSLLLTIVFFSRCNSCLLLSDIRDRLRNSERDDLKGRTTGKIISIEPIKRMTQRKTGTKIFTDGYKVLYKYTISKKEHDKTDILFLSKANEKLIVKLLNRTAEDTVWLSYDLNKPGRSAN